MQFFVKLIKELRDLKDLVLSSNSLLVVGIVYLISSVIFGGYMMIFEGQALIDALYYLVTTSTTVGYGDISPTTSVGKVLSMFYMIISIASLGMIISVVGEKIYSIAEKKQERTNCDKRKSSDV